MQYISDVEEKKKEKLQSGTYLSLWKNKKNKINNVSLLLKSFNGWSNILSCLHHPAALMPEAVYGEGLAFQEL